MDNINTKREQFFSKHKEIERFRYLLANELSYIFNEELIKSFCSNFQNSRLDIALGYTNYDFLLKYFGNTVEDIDKLNLILDNFILDNSERKKIFNVSGKININVLNGKLKIKRFNNDDFVDIILENNNGVSYDIVNSYQGLGHTYNDDYCKKYLLYLFGINTYYEDFRYGIVYEITKIDDNNYSIKIHDKEYMDQLKFIKNNFRPGFTALS